jgi:hypothetical protein
MSTMWALIEVCFADARKAEELVGELSARRELRLDPQRALSAFVLWKGQLPMARIRRAHAPRHSREFAPVVVRSR